MLAVHVQVSRLLRRARGAVAHRKPLGTTCRTLADWHGPLPMLGDYLVTPAGTWYLVVGIEEKRNPAKVGLVLERAAEPCMDAAECSAVNPDGTVGLIHEFEWYPRRRSVRLFG